MSRWIFYASHLLGLGVSVAVLTSLPIAFYGASALWGGMYGDEAGSPANFLLVPLLALLFAVGFSCLLSLPLAAFGCSLSSRNRWNCLVWPLLLVSLFTIVGGMGRWWLHLEVSSWAALGFGFAVSLCFLLYWVPFLLAQRFLPPLERWATKTLKRLKPRYIELTSKMRGSSRTYST